jgi:hypothetical protein
MPLYVARNGRVDLSWNEALEAWILISQVDCLSALSRHV